MAGQWRYALYDLLTSRLLAEHMPFTVDPYTWMLGEAGTLTASLKLGDPAIRKRKPQELILPGRTALVVHRDETPVWDGIIWTARPQRSDRTLKISASERRSYFGHRRFRPELGYGSGKTLAFTGADLFDVFRQIVRDCQELEYLGIQPGNLGIETDTTPSGVLVNRLDLGSELGAYHGWDFATYEQLLDDLAGTDPGLEWRIHTYLDTNQTPKRRLLLGSPRLGQGPLNPDIVTFEFPGQILDYEWPYDREPSANYVAALGAGDGDALKWAEAYNNSELLAGWPLLEVTTSHKDDSSLTTLAERATADLARLKGDRTVPSIDLQGYPGGVAPGDYVRVRISDEEWWPGSAANPFEATVRVIGLRVTPGPEERTSLIIEEPRDAA